MKRFADRLPVIVGVGECLDRPASPAEGKEPMALMAEALQAAEQDAGAALLGHVDTLRVVREFSWPYRDAPGLLAWRLGMPVTDKAYGEDGGETPMRFLHEAAQRIARGESGVVAVVGAESAHTVSASWKANVKLPWQHRDEAARMPSGRDLVSPGALAHGLVQPIHVYPLFENAFVAAAGQTQQEGINESAALFSRFSAVAARQPSTWSTEVYSAEDIATPGPQNRWIAWPYTKRMVANPLVNQGAAFLLTNLARARELGIAEERMIHVWGGAEAREHRDFLQRDSYARSPAQEAVLLSLAERVGGAEAFQALELYSCFPCVPKMSVKTLGLKREVPLTVTGGLSFFGAPLNNYMSHATVAMVRHLRAADARPALLYGQGEFVTKHHGVVVAREPGPDAFHGAPMSVQDRADLLRGAVPNLVEDDTGAATLETFTVVYGREMQPDYGAVIARTVSGERLIAQVPATDTDTLARLLDPGASPVGLSGTVSRLDAKRLRWSLR
jgi:acetyl-CoA acetyltransferase